MKNNPFDALLKKLHNKNWGTKFHEHTDQIVKVVHSDRSEFLFMSAVWEKYKIGNQIMLAIFPEHNCINLFYETDLEYVEVQPRKGKKYMLPIQGECSLESGKLKFSAFRKGKKTITAAQYAAEISKRKA